MTPYVTVPVNGNHVALPVYRKGILVNIYQALTYPGCLAKVRHDEVPGTPAILSQGQTYERAFGVSIQTEEGETA